MSLYRRAGSPFWWSKISIAGHETRQSTKTKDREQAEEFDQRESERLWRLHKLGDKSAVLWSTVAARWMKETTKRSKDMDAMILKWLAPHIGNEAISELDSAAINELRELCLDDGEKQRSPATVDRYMCLVRSILKKCAGEWELLDRSPVVPMYNAETEEPRWLTHAEWDRLQDELPDHLKLAAHLAVLTGLRMRAMLSLTWDRIDMKAKRLWIPGRQQKAKRTHGIPVTPEAIGVLKKLRKLNPTGSFVFQWKGNQIDDVNGKSYQDALERAGVEGANWHTLRHTFAAWAVQNEVTLLELMALGDWTSYQSVLKYSHLAPDHLALAASKISTKQAHSKSSARPKVQK